MPRLPALPIALATLGAGALVLGGALVLPLKANNAPAAQPPELAAATFAIAAEAAVADRDGFQTFLSPHELKPLLGRDDVIVVDARKADAYATGHIPGAINLPPNSLRTPSAKPGEGDSQYLFRTADGQPDIARYEQVLGQAGISRDKTVVVYGEHAGKADGTIAAMILDWLGQERVLFLDGVGLEQWTAAGYDVGTGPTTLAAVEFDARPRPAFVWNLDDVVGHLGNSDVLFYDTRSLGEFVGTDPRDNKHSGRIPGAIHADYYEFLDSDTHTVKPRTEIEAILAAHGVNRFKNSDKTIVLYCQTATRVSLPYLVLRELGYENVAVYDASWHEYGNRDDTPKVAGE